MYIYFKPNDYLWTNFRLELGQYYVRQNQLLSLDDLKFQIHVLVFFSELLPKVLLYWSQFFANV